MVSNQTKKKQRQSVPPSSKKVKTKVVKKDKKVHPKSKRGQINLAQSKKNYKQDGSVKHSIEVRV